MKTHLDCLPCFVGQAVRSARMVSDDPAVHERVVRAVLAATAQLDLSQCPPAMGRQVHLLIRDAVGDADPYGAIKRAFNETAQRLLPGLERRVAAAADPFEAALRVAIAGNIIDFGVPGARVDEERLRQTIERCLVAELDRGLIAELAEATRRATSILVLVDNAGEIVLDRLLLGQLAVLAADARLTVATRGGPVINDATLADAEEAGLGELAELIDNGDDTPGTDLTRCSASFRRCFDEATLVIAKGQGNFETLAETTPREVTFLFQAKCKVVAAHIGCPRGTPVICRAGPG